jgi:hypothetical protein
LENLSIKLIATIKFFDYTNHNPIAKMATKEQQHGEVKMKTLKINGTGFYFDGGIYHTFFNGKRLGGALNRSEAWRMIGFAQWGRLC